LIRLFFAGKMALGFPPLALSDLLKGTGRGGENEMQDRALWDKEEDDMSETVLASPRKSDLLEIVKTLSDVTRKLSEITRALAAQAGESPYAIEALAESEAALAQASRHLSMLQEEETHQQEREEARRKLRKDILVELSRRGRAFPLELAAAILTFVEDIEPVLRELEKEGLVRIRRVAGTEVIELTPRGRDAARRLNGL
jgi:DNA-binding MarR family transcriptional regulator